jgi:predicted TPR repeat methyltransferase
MARNVADARFWDRTARRYAADPIEDQDGYVPTVDRTRHYLLGTDTVLELGCGTGTTALQLAAHVSRIVATDLSSEMIAIAREGGRSGVRQRRVRRRHAGTRVVA